MAIKIEDLNFSTTLDRVEAANLAGGLSLTGYLPYWKRGILSGARRNLVKDTIRAKRMRDERFFIPATGWTDPVGPMILR